MSMRMKKKTSAWPTLIKNVTGLTFNATKKLFQFEKVTKVCHLVQPLFYGKNLMLVRKSENLVEQKVKN